MGQFPTTRSYDLINLVFKVIAHATPVDIKIPSVVKAELLLGAYKSKTPQKSLEKLEQFLEPFEVVPINESVCYE